MRCHPYDLCEPCPVIVFSALDAFDLPEWLGDSEVVWASTSRLHGVALVAGALTSGEEQVPCDLLAVDRAYPAPVADESIRHDAHQAWKYGEVLLASNDGRATLIVPGVEFTAELTLAALGRLAKAVGAKSERYAVLLRLDGG